MDYVTKPFDIEDLLGKINTHCRPDASPSKKRAQAPVLAYRAPCATWRQRSTR